MKFAYVPAAEYKIGQVIKVQGRKMIVISTAPMVAAPLTGNAQRVICIATDAQAIEEVTHL